MNTEVCLIKPPPKPRSSHSTQYSVVCEDLYDPQLGVYRTYGIQVVSFGTVWILHDVSSCESVVSRLVELINRWQLSPVHLQDVVMDMLP